MDVVFYEVFKEEEFFLKKHLPSSIEALFLEQTIQQSDHTRPLAPIISIRTQSKIPSAWAKNLKGVLSRSTGYDHLVRYRKEHPAETAVYGHLPEYCSRAVAEQAILLLMALMRRLPNQMQQFKDFNRSGLTGLELQGKNLLVVGVGNIGSEVVDLGKGLRMNVKGVDVVKRLEGLQYVSLMEGIVSADAVICCLPLTTETEGLLSYDLLRQNQRGFFIVNVSRGEVTPITDMHRLLQEGNLQGVAMDVYPHEAELANVLRGKTSAISKEVETILDLAQDTKVIFTPHNAFNTKESTERKAKLTIEAIENFLDKGTFPYTLKND